MACRAICSRHSLLPLFFALTLLTFPAPELATGGRHAGEAPYVILILAYDTNCKEKALGPDSIYTVCMRSFISFDFNVDEPACIDAWRLHGRGMQSILFVIDFSRSNASAFINGCRSKPSKSREQRRIKNAVAIWTVTISKAVRDSTWY